MPGNVAPAEGERANLLAYLAQQRYSIRLTAFGLTDDQARATPTSSALSVGGLIKHVTAMERNWMDIVLQRNASNDTETEYRDDFRMSPDQTLKEILDDSELCGCQTDEIIAGIADLGQAVPVPKGVPWFPDDLEAWSVRWVLLHVIEEIARHAGHADIIREHIDGGTMYPIMAAAEHWPEAPWMQPWTPSGDQIMPSAERLAEGP